MILTTGVVYAGGGGRAALRGVKIAQGYRTKELKMKDFKEPTDGKLKHGRA